jgi:hypothetical protein
MSSLLFFWSPSLSLNPTLSPQEITSSAVFEEADDDWQDDYIHNKTVLEGYRAARRQSWGLQDFSSTFNQMYDSSEEEEEEEDEDEDEDEYYGYNDGEEEEEEEDDEEYYQRLVAESRQQQQYAYEQYAEEYDSEEREQGESLIPDFGRLLFFTYL